jgi:hypothetical protein
VERRHEWRLPDWLQVDFAGVQAIGEIDIFTQQDNSAAPADPTPGMTFALYGLSAFQVQYWTGGAWDQTGPVWSAFSARRTLASPSAAGRSAISLHSA